MIYDFTAEKLVSDWLGFCSKKTWPTDLDMTKIELFENEGFRQEKLKLEEQSKETKFKSDHMPQIQLDADMLNEYGITISDEDVKQINKLNEVNKEETVNVVQNGDTNGQSNDQSNDQSNNQSNNQSNDQQNETKTNGHTQTATGQQNGHTQTATGQQNGQQNANTANACILENKLNESVELVGDNQIQNHYGELLGVQEWINTDKTRFVIQPLNSELHITKAYKTAQIKTHEANEMLNESIDEMYELLASKLMEEAGGLGDTLFIGRIILENYNDIKNRVLLLENPRLFQRKLKIDLSKVQSYSLFPGQIVCFEGEIQPDSNNLIVNKFYDNELLLPAFNQTPIKLSNTPIYIMAASGPISPPMSDDLSNLEHLLEQVKIFQPHYLILLGPFFDCRNDYLLFNCDGEKFFNKIMRMISSSLVNIATEAIIVPSTFDLNNYNIYPAPPFEHSFPKIQFMPNPSFLNLNGIVISITSVDIIRHINREEIKR